MGQNRKYIDEKDTECSVEMPETLQDPEVTHPVSSQKVAADGQESSERNESFKAYKL